MQGGNLRTLQLWQPAITTWTNLGLADLRSASWKPPDENEMARLAKIVDALPVGERWQRDSKARLKRLITAGTQSDESPDFALDGVLLVDDVSRWQRLDRSRLTTDVHTYDEALLPFLADLARSDPHVARGVASRVRRPWIPGQITQDNKEALLEERGRAARLARGLLDRAGPALPEDVRKRLSKIASQFLEKE
jgi:hypothetical protein